ncbi:MAG: glutamine-hydrolyzing carbamoyl-phosphate synthase small subunit [Deltaproteobacteria bacterium]|nr:glutamine-hydrolyzing carbamoyl-phosphate synthase small subunit [Deltaproteobacteria bacterium]
MQKKATLALACGEVFEGLSVGAQGETIGEVVFNTAHTGYQEILTDPSYIGQLVTFTVAEVGNYGIHEQDGQAARAMASGFIARRACKEPSNFRSTEALPKWLERSGIVGIEGLDTRRLVRVLRSAGAQTGIIDSTGASAAALVERAKNAPGMEGQDLATQVSTRETYQWTEGSEGHEKVALDKRVVVVDFGVKRGILRQLVDHGCHVTVVNSRTTASEIFSHKPQGVMLSNGPGDPAAVPGAGKMAAELLGKVPIFGICLGHQILSLGLGGKTYKLKFGHRGANHPVRELIGGHIDLTSQNHGFAADEQSLKGKAEVTHINLNDGTVEGIHAPDAKMFAVQYHPEDSPGPHDSRYLFRRFTQLIESA